MSWGPRQGTLSSELFMISMILHYSEIYSSGLEPCSLHENHAWNRGPIPAAALIYDPDSGEDNPGSKWDRDHHSAQNLTQSSAESMR